MYFRGLSRRIVVFQNLRKSTENSVSFQTEKDVNDVMRMPMQMDTPMLNKIIKNRGEKICNYTKPIIGYKLGPKPFVHKIPLEQTHEVDLTWDP